MKILDVQPVTLQGEFVRLEPPRLNHAPDLAAQYDADNFRFFSGYRPSANVEEVERYIESCLGVKDRRIFAIVDLKSGKAVGSTSYLEIRASDLGVEIGATWLGKPYQGTKINPECKLLLLTHAFETLGCIRVQLRTDMRNIHSQRAIEKLGAIKEGILRKHVVMPDGYFRDTVLYSIIEEEWPRVKAGLIERLKSS
jgi:RimJ/RimL family protein N-acetyltransferase